MTNIISQFHAVPEELLLFTQECVAEFGLHFTVFKAFPKQVLEASVEDLPRFFTDPRVWRIAFTPVPPSLPAMHELDFADQNPDALYLDIGRVTEHGLEESCLLGRTSDEKTLAIWKKVAKKLKRMTKAGATVINPDTGVAGHVRDHRYSMGAKALQQQGVIMKALGGNRFEFPDVP